MNEDPHTPNPYSAPRSAPVHTGESPDAAWEYIGFWKRTLAYIIDQIAMGLIGIVVGIVCALAIRHAGAVALVANLAGLVIGIAYTVGFWVARNATPGKMVFGATIRRHHSFTKPSTGQYIGRYFAYILSMLPLGLGCFWAAFHPQKRGWHDLLAGTVVVRRARPGRGVRTQTRVVRRAPPPPVRSGARPVADLPPARPEA